jgi:GTP cyclohydrolase I
MSSYKPVAAVPGLSPVRASQSLSRPLSEDERAAMIDAASTKIGELFDILRIDHPNDHNTNGTPLRVAKSLVNELLAGRYSPPPAITEFDNIERYDDLIVTGPITVRSLCAHHMLPIYGDAFIGIVPSLDGRIVGLSKYDRIVDFFARRLQSQEELVNQIGRFIMQRTRPAGLMVRISAVHMCKTHRGVSSSHDGRMVTTFARGTLRDDTELRREFLAECRSRETV